MTRGEFGHMHDVNGCWTGLRVTWDPEFLGVPSGWSVQVTKCMSGLSAPKWKRMECGGEYENVEPASTRTGLVDRWIDGRQFRAWYTAGT